MYLSVDDNFLQGKDEDFESHVRAVLETRYDQLKTAVLNCLSDLKS